MAKRNTKQAMYQPRQAQPYQRKAARKPAAKTGRAAGKERDTRQARSNSHPAQSTARTPAQTNLLMVRIAAIAVVIFAIAGGVEWAISLQGNYNALEVVGLILLGFLAGLGLVVALRTEQIVARVTKTMRERRR